MSEKLIRSHWENNYIGSVKTLNMVASRLLAAMNDPELPPIIYGGLKREELHRVGSVVLHEQYFGNLGGDGKAGGDVLAAIKKAYGSYEAWDAEFRRTAMSLAGGSGWCVLTYNVYTNELRNQWAWDHMHGAIAARPLLVLDMYEHSYHMDYGSAAAKYVDAFMRNVNWEEVDRRFGARRHERFSRDRRSHSCAASRSRTIGPAASQVVFVCEHGNVKSLMAASYFNQLAEQRGLRVRAISRGSAPDSNTVPQPVATRLRADGVDVSNFHPAKVEAAEVAEAARVVTIGTNLPAGCGPRSSAWNVGTMCRRRARATTRRGRRSSPTSPSCSIDWLLVTIGASDHQFLRLPH